MDYPTLLPGSCSPSGRIERPLSYKERLRVRYAVSLGAARLSSVIMLVNHAILEEVLFVPRSTGITGVYRTVVARYLATSSTSNSVYRAVLTCSVTVTTPNVLL